MTATFYRERGASPGQHEFPANPRPDKLRQIAMSSVRCARHMRRLCAAVAVLMLSGCGTAPSAPSAGGDRMQLFQEAYNGITKYYIDPVTADTLALAGLHQLATVDGGLVIERHGDAVVLRHGAGATTFAAPAGSDAEGWAALTDNVTTVARANSAAVAALSRDRLDQTLLEGSIGVLDRFSHYAPPDLAQERRASRDGFGGIGVTLNTEGAEIRIVEILPETPAAAAGLHVDDRIVAIDGIATGSLPRDEVVHRLRGPTDSVVALAVARAGAVDQLSFSVHRARIVPPSVLLTEDRGVAHLRVSSFNQQTSQSLADLLRQAHRDLGGNLHGIILDLRGNPGGLLDQSIEVASMFLDGAPVSSTVGRVPESIQYFTAPHRRVEKLPVAVLVNGSSASASEIVAAALQDAGRAVIVGSTSYGKGTVQNVQHMPNEGELTITWARLIAPGGYILHQHGVVPTICTADLPDDAGGVAAALASSTGALSVELGKSRAKLDDAAWQRLRDMCPGQHDDHEIEVKTAQKLLTDPALYARVMAQAPAAAQRPVATAGVVR
jgi:carboxyl-terminal processing protease